MVFSAIGLWRNGRIGLSEVVVADPKELAFVADGGPALGIDLGISLALAGDEGRFAVRIWDRGGVDSTR